jgi:hypothetical protein
MTGLRPFDKLWAGCLRQAQADRQAQAAFDKLGLTDRLRLTFTIEGFEL